MRCVCRETDRQVGVIDRKINKQIGVECAVQVNRNRRALRCAGIKAGKQAGGEP